MSDDVELDTKNLDQLIKALKGQLPNARVGILGTKTTRNKAEVSASRSVDATSGKAPKIKFDAGTNASVGALHEFGSERMPMRSFLRVPLADNLQKEMESSGAFTPDSLSEVIKQGSVMPWLKKIAVLAEGIVAGAFETGGYGKWPAWKTKNYKNGDNRILVDTGQLRDSITSEVK